MDENSMTKAQDLVDATTNITKMRRVRASGQVTKQLEEAILRGSLTVGGRLPAERDLQEKLKVSRNTLRESLRELEQKGLIEIRKGRAGGIFIKELNAGPMSESLGLFVQSQRISMKDISEFRQDLEGLVARRAAMRAKSINFDDIYALLKKAEILAGMGPTEWMEFMEVDKEIHLTLAKLGGNLLHHYFLQTVHDNMHHDSITAYLPRNLEIINMTLKELQAIVIAVSHGDEVLAESLARNHVAQATEIMFMNQNIDD